jgi:hypothetical protein
MIRLREADCPQTAFLEARGDLHPRLVFLCENVAADLTKPGLRIALERNWPPVLRLQPTNRRLHSGARSRKTIQYP